MTLSDLQGHLTIANLFKRDLSYSCAAADKISTPTAHHGRSICDSWASSVYIQYPNGEPKSYTEDK